MGIFYNLFTKNKRDKLVKILRDPFEQEGRKREVLQKLIKQKALEHLIIVLKSANEHDKKIILDAICEIGGKRVLEFLPNMLQDYHFSVREKAAEVLAKLGWEPSNDEERIYYMIAQSKWEEVVTFGNQAVKQLTESAISMQLGKIHEIIGLTIAKMGKSAIEQVLQIYTSNAASREYIISTRTLSFIFVHLVQLKQFDKLIINHLIKDLNNENSSVRVDACTILGHIKDPESVEPLIKILKNDNDYKVRKASVSALGEIQDVRILAALKQAKNDNHYEVIMEVEKVLEESKKIDRKKGKAQTVNIQGLMWQQLGSETELRYEDAKKYIDQLNQEKIAGFNDWRLPTLKEAELLSVIEQKKWIRESGIFKIWTSEVWISPSGGVKAMNAYVLGLLDSYKFVAPINPDYEYSDKHYVKAVRTL